MGWSDDSPPSLLVPPAELIPTLSLKHSGGTQPWAPPCNNTLSLTFGPSPPSGCQAWSPGFLQHGWLARPLPFQGGCEGCQGTEDPGPRKSFPRIPSVSQGLSPLCAAFQPACDTVCQAACMYVGEELRKQPAEAALFLHPHWLL